MKITSKLMALIITLVLFGGITITGWLGWWATETSKTPVKYAEGEAAGEYNPADIRGSYSFGDVSELFEIPLADLQAAFRLPADDPASFQLKSLEALYAGLETEIGTASVRLFSAWYKGLPYEPTEETYLFPEAIEILKAQANLTPDQIAYLDSHVAIEGAASVLPEATPQPEPTALAAQPTPVGTEHTPVDRNVNAKTTFQNLLDWGVSVADIEQVLGGTMPAADAIVKDYVTAQGKEFSTTKTALQALVDQAKP